MALSLESKLRSAASSSNLWWCSDSVLAFGYWDKISEAVNLRRGKFDEFDSGTVWEAFVYGWLCLLAVAKLWSREGLWGYAIHRSQERIKERRSGGSPCDLILSSRLYLIKVPTTPNSTKPSTHEFWGAFQAQTLEYSIPWDLDWIIWSSQSILLFWLQPLDISTSTLTSQRWGYRKARLFIDRDSDIVITGITCT